MPNFSFNVISVVRLIREIRCIVIFYDDLCVIQERILNSLIGLGRLRGGVYCFDNFSSVAAQFNAVGSHNLWHEHVGHLFD